MARVLDVGDEDALSEGPERTWRGAELTLAETQRLAELGSWSWDVAANTVSWSDELYRLFGYAPGEIEASVEAFLAGIHLEDRQMASEAILAVADGHGESFVFDFRMVLPDGRMRWQRGRGQGVRDEQGTVVRLFGTVQDITASREAEQQLREQRDEMALLAGVMQATDDAVIVFSLDGTILRWNEGAEHLYGYSAGQAVGQHISLILTAEQAEGFPDMIAELAAGRHIRTDSADVREDGTQLLTSVTVSPIEPNSGPVTAAVGISRDVTEQRRSEEREREHASQLEWLALHDPLTGLANRALLFDRLGHALAHRGEPRTVVLLLDLDNFKTVNDVSGHAAGDRLLVEVGRRLLACVRPEDTVARLGGDEFAILLEGADADAGAVAKRVHEALSDPVTIGNQLIVPRASIGFACSDDTQDPDQLLLRADVAMYAAKADGKNRTKAFAPEMAEAIRTRADMESALRGAVPRGEIVVHYQPIISVAAGTVTRFEALVRWQRPEGLVPPYEFLHLAESSGMIKEIGSEVLRQALAATGSWLRDDPQRSVSVNVSGVQLTNALFAEEILSALESADVRPAQLVLEVTESMFLASESVVVEQLKALRGHGVCVSIDDFGSGYSSFGQLHRLPVNSIKIDKSFLDDVRTGDEDHPILDSMIAMARHLGLAVTAEGIETRIQAERSAALGCEYLQGYYFARPVPAGELAAATDAANEASEHLRLNTPQR